MIWIYIRKSDQQNSINFALALTTISIDLNWLRSKTLHTLINPVVLLPPLSLSLSKQKPDWSRYLVRWRWACRLQCKFQLRQTPQNQTKSKSLYIKHKNIIHFNTHIVEIPSIMFYTHIFVYYINRLYYVFLVYNFQHLVRSIHIYIQPNGHSFPPFFFSNTQNLLSNTID